MNCQQYLTFKFLAFAQNNITPDDSLIHQMSIKAGSCRQILENLLENDFKFTAIFAFSDLIVWEAVYTLNMSGLRVPDDITFIGAVTQIIE